MGDGQRNQAVGVPIKRGVNQCLMFVLNGPVGVQVKRQAPISLGLLI